MNSGAGRGLARLGKTGTAGAGRGSHRDGPRTAVLARTRCRQGQAAERRLASALVAIHPDDPDEAHARGGRTILCSLSFAGTRRRTTSSPTRSSGCWSTVRHGTRRCRPLADRRAVDEILRFDTSVPVWRRVATRGHDRRRCRDSAGAKLYLWLAATGRDPQRWSEPDRVRHLPSRAHRPLAFGKASTSASGRTCEARGTPSRSRNSPHAFRRWALVPDQHLTYTQHLVPGPQHLWVTQG